MIRPCAIIYELTRWVNFKYACVKWKIKILRTFRINKRFGAIYISINDA